uniref:DEAD-box ATP-dependent RNA helicase 52C n=1 Tax=Elaeis guineensis var. tenera TaxID=51953 RepID=A0A6I9QJ67_ELAGV|nr:DEAD-box ATP-dependent RNA helicase 52C [Elaeis guineensis]
MTNVHQIGRAGKAAKMGLATAFFNERNSSLARPLAELMQEANQEVPAWLSRYAACASYGGGRHHQSGGGGRFGDRDFHRDASLSRYKGVGDYYGGGSSGGGGYAAASLGHGGGCGSDGFTSAWD